MKKVTGSKAPVVQRRRQTPRSGNGRSNRECPIEPRFVYVVLSPRRDVIVCKLDSVALYEMPVAALECAENWDGSAAVSARVVEKGLGAAIQFASGVQIEFPSDLVLYHCEPRYPWRKGTTKPSRIGEHVRFFREQAGMSLQDLSLKTGVAVPNLLRLEHGKLHPMIETLQKLARALGVQPRMLLSRFPIGNEDGNRRAVAIGFRNSGKGHVLRRRGVGQARSAVMTGSSS